MSLGTRSRGTREEEELTGGVCVTGHQGPGELLKLRVDCWPQRSCQIGKHSHTCLLGTGYEVPRACTGVQLYTAMTRITGHASLFHNVQVSMAVPSLVTVRYVRPR